MRFATFMYEGKEAVGVLDNTCQNVIDLHKVQRAMKQEVTLPDTMIECIRQGQVFLNEVAELLQWSEKNGEEEYKYSLDNSGLKLLAPIPRPLKNIFCVGKNYAAHAIEMGSAADIPEHPMIFSKAPTTVIGPNETVLNHKDITNELDYEGEIAVIIGKKGKGIKKEEVQDYIFGYTLLNDVTARDLQRRHQQYLLGKSLDTACPMGPWITHESLIEDTNNLQLETKINGEVRQSANTKQFIFDIPTIISTISAGTTLEPGDIIATGTPSGVGSGFKPPKHLQPGDEMVVTVPELGVLINKVEQ